MNHILKTGIATAVLLFGDLAMVAEDENPGTFTIPDVRFDEEGRATVEVYFESDIEGYNGLQMDFWMPAEITIESDEYGPICDVNPRFARGYSFIGADRTHTTDPALVEEGVHFYRLVGFSARPIPSPCRGLFYSFTVLASTARTATDEPVNVHVTNIEFSPQQGDAPAYLNTFPDMDFKIEPYQQTGVELNPMETVTDGTIYDTQGRCLGTDVDVQQPGVYIMGGRKVLVR